MSKLLTIRSSDFAESSGAVDVDSIVTPIINEVGLQAIGTRELLSSTTHDILDATVDVNNAINTEIARVITEVQYASDTQTELLNTVATHVSEIHSEVVPETTPPVDP